MSWLVYLLVFASDLSGQWEIQSMGGDRQVVIEQKAAKVIVHRTLWPEFEGKKYRLEHLYRGNVSGQKISGQLLVKEEEAKEFETLREFVGAMKSDSEVTIDGLPMRRLSTGATPPSAPVKEKTENRPSEPPPLAQNDKTATPTPAEDPGVSLFDSIMGGAGMADLFKVSSAVSFPDDAAEKIAQGDALLKKNKTGEALLAYQEAEKLTRQEHPELLHRMGRCYLRLNNRAEAKRLLGRALRLDPNNRQLRKDYSKSQKA